ncbi:response regulator transcription factor [Pontibacter litorisediminis]|uniref:response regulator transcription factor n=1 Tax=Pontibacter litorisediminis TaxID=1846260 RepID=UPI0023ECFA16|nr:response regulator transcription factor [Pontibacter litorisediminis]
MSDHHTIRIILTDDHRIVREGLACLLHSEAAIEVVGEAANGKELLELLRHTPADVVLLDVQMPIMDGYETLELLKEHHPEVRVVILTMQDNAIALHRLMECGATSYLLKDASRVELCSAIKLAAKGTAFISSGMSIKMLQKVLRPTADGAVENTTVKELSKREVEVLTLISDGYTNAEIAEKLFTSKRTIETHRQNILEKTHTKNTAHLIKYAMQRNLIPLTSNQIRK